VTELNKEIHQHLNTSKCESCELLAQNLSQLSKVESKKDFDVKGWPIKFSQIESSCSTGKCLKEEVLFLLSSMPLNTA